MNRYRNDVTLTAEHIDFFMKLIQAENVDYSHTKRRRMPRSYMPSMYSDAEMRSFEVETETVYNFDISATSMARVVDSFSQNESRAIEITHLNKTVREYERKSRELQKFCSMHPSVNKQYNNLLVMLKLAGWDEDDLL